MSFDKKSDYAVNKKSEDIVYRFADGASVSIKRGTDGIIVTQRSSEGDIVVVSVSEKEMPADSFEHWKPLLDEDYRERERAEIHSTRRDVSLYLLEETECVSCESTEDVVVRNEEPPENYRTIENARSILATCLTETQRRRYFLYHRDGLTYRKIAELEGVDPMAIQRSLKYAEKKIKKVLGNS